VAVVAVADQIQIEAEAVHMGFLGPGQRQAAVGRVAGVVEVIRLAAAVARGDALDLEAGDAGDRGPADEPIRGELDRRELDAAKIADQMGRPGRRRPRRRPSCRRP
jgi:hypothetical protein